MGKRENVLKNLKKTFPDQSPQILSKMKKINNETVLKISCYEMQ